ncbi:hypothetical protein [Actinomadura sp. SCN-SB]|uniref:hypothetical protein n=1 Tax=Actinomadura sp. SCN-SB TaxID=3373092 RepID=UPI003752E631
MKRILVRYVTPLVVAVGLIIGGISGFFSLRSAAKREWRTNPIPDLCRSFDWNPITAAGNWVPFLGVLAGFVFAGIIVILSERPGQGTAATNALKLLFTAFFSLVVTAYLSTIISGEQTCPRANTAQAFLGGILAIAIIAMIVALSWLLVAYQRDNHGTLAFLRRLIYFSLFLAAVMLDVSSAGYLTASYRISDHTVANIAMALVTLAAIVLVAVLVRGKSRVRWLEWVKSRIRWRDREPSWWVDAVAWSILAYLATASVGIGVVLSISPRAWYPPPLWLIYLTAWAVLIAPLIVLAISVMAIAQESPTASSTQTSKPS